MGITDHFLFVWLGIAQVLIEHPMDVAEPVRACNVLHRLTVGPIT